ncbi:hypothetical protein EVAR_46634_1 [Eumeta japonica]|uniref:Uncharacterized protein n=1 Tax=Eumeta variegata TaxID=151549 RepID=A0A4C1WHL3_EUMVA|nr:hypothetical protein EVAR_46634_1 [Eumeta japonica]
MIQWSEKRLDSKPHGGRLTCRLSARRGAQRFAFSNNRRTDGPVGSRIKRVRVKVEMQNRMLSFVTQIKSAVKAARADRALRSFHYSITSSDCSFQLESVVFLTHFKKASGSSSSSVILVYH